MLGAVDKVKDFKIHVSLPNNLSGIVPITEVSDTLSDVLASKMDKVSLISLCNYRFNGQSTCLNRRTTTMKKMRR